MKLDEQVILAATEEVLRRHGPAKAGVVDVAKVLGVSHAAVYRYFPSKAALREAVARRWLGRAHGELAAIAHGEGPDRLRAWLTALFASKRAVALEDPELFATYGVLVREHAGVATEHVADLLAQLTTIVGPAAQAVFDATVPFHHPVHAPEWADPDAEARLAAVIDLLVSALGAR